MPEARLAYPASGLLVNFGESALGLDNPFQGVVRLGEVGLGPGEPLRGWRQFGLRSGRRRRQRGRGVDVDVLHVGPAECERRLELIDNRRRER